MWEFRVVSSCDFSISPDGNWLQFTGDISPFAPEDSRIARHQRQTELVDLATDTRVVLEPDPLVQERIAEGIAPNGLGCFNPESNAIYLTAIDWDGRSRQGPSGADESIEMRQGDAPQSGITALSRQRLRFHYRADITESPAIIRLADGANCSERTSPQRPDIRVEKPSGKRIEL
ncbi:MAG: hypothetical protein LAT84_08875 [Balneolia bacterium]|nr:hypothetical protein [Balneolia bacterium]